MAEGACEKSEREPSIAAGVARTIAQDVLSRDDSTRGCRERGERGRGRESLPKMVGRKRNVFERARGKHCSGAWTTNTSTVWGKTRGGKL